MMTPEVKLKDIFSRSNSVSDIDDVDCEIVECIKCIGDNCLSQRGVYTVCVTLLVYKIIYPKQDIRLHQAGMKGGFSGRSFDTSYITPTLKQLGLPSMAESGWLTRSLEQPFPYTLDYRGRISGGVKIFFLKVLDYVEKEPKKAENILRLLLNQVIEINKKSKVSITHINNTENITITMIVEALSKHFLYSYKTHNGAKLPVIAFYSLYQSLIKEVKRYENCNLNELGSLTASDRTSKTAGDIEIFENSNLFEAVEIKLNKKIDENIVAIAREKIYKYNPRRYYILSNCGINEEYRDAIQKIIIEVKKDHGCQIIINGLIPTIQYYLRLINSLSTFMKNYGDNIERDSELQAIHKNVWNLIIEENFSNV